MLLLLLSPCVAALCLTLASPATAAPTPTPAGRGGEGGGGGPRRAGPHNKVLLVSFDGFRWDYDRDVDTPHLDAMARDGVKAQYNHGVVHNMWFNTTTKEKKGYYPTQFQDDWWDNGSLPIWITAQRQGEEASVREVEPWFYNYSNESSWHRNVDTVMEWFAGPHDLDLVTLYFGEPDSVGHKYGPDSKQRREMVEQVDRTVGYMRAAAEFRGLASRLNVIITADHGMSKVFPNSEVERLITLAKIPGFSFADLSFHLVDYGPSGMLLPKPGRLDKVYAALKGAHPHLNVYKKEEMPAHMHFSNNDRILPIVLWADPGYLINGYLPVQTNVGEHGFDNQIMDMKPFFRAVGPAFQKNLEVGPFETVNIYPLMCHILGIRPEVNDGHLDATKHMLASAGEGETLTWPLRVPAAPSGTAESDVSDSMSTVDMAVTGLAAVVGFLAVVFVVVVSVNVYKRRKATRG
ncbi:hypothetical protein CRUP_018534 [Coryphaenoides rupestris]|nr:hypothetical protein CRUP_018534 [Coryphaenoides rupestris]